MKSNTDSVLLGAAFLMATSAIGPGFLTQTTIFTSQLYADFGFAILISIIVDMVAQLNIWRIITLSNKRAQEIGNELFPGVGTLLSILIVTGGLVFNIGNVAGCGLGLNVLFGIDIRIGALMSAVISILIFLIKEAGLVMDWFAKILGILMIGLMFYVAIQSQPPLLLALEKSILPDMIDFTSIVTIIGGTVGGYITFAGAHRLLDAGIYGKENLIKVNQSAATAIGIASLMRILLFLATLGVVMQGFIPDIKNPAASVFQLAAGEVGYKLFGIVIWAAAVTSVVGGSFTSISFAQSFHPLVSKNKNYFIIGFISFATLLFMIFDRPVKILVFAGAFNGLILAFSLGIMLLAATQTRIMKEYKHPLAYTVGGFIVVFFMLIFGSIVVFTELEKLFFGN